MSWAKVITHTQHGIMDVRRVGSIRRRFQLTCHMVVCRTCAPRYWRKTRYSVWCRNESWSWPRTTSRDLRSRSTRAQEPAYRWPATQTVARKRVFATLLWDQLAGRSCQWLFVWPPLLGVVLETARRYEQKRIHVARHADLHRSRSICDALDGHAPMCMHHAVININELNSILFFRVWTGICWVRF